MAATDRKTTVKQRPRLIPQPHGGALRSGGTPGNKGGGRLKEYAEERAAQLAADPMVWDVQLARAKAGDLKPLVFATERAFGKPKETLDITSGGKPLLIGLDL